MNLAESYYHSTKSMCSESTLLRKENARKLLPIDFRPNSYSVVIGRGKVCTDAVGNQRLRVLASNFLEQYASCQTKVEKTEVVSQLVQIVRDGAHVGAFVKRINGRWWEMDSPTARTKVGYVLRDLLFDRYRSSSKAKVARRRAKRLQQRVESSSAVNSNSDSTKDNKNLKETQTKDVTLSPRIRKTNKNSASSHPVSDRQDAAHKEYGGFFSKNSDIRLTPLLEQVLRITTNPRTEAIFTPIDHNRGATSNKWKSSNMTTTTSPLEAMRFDALVAAYDRIFSQDRTCVDLPSISLPRHQQVLGYVCNPSPFQVQEDDFPDDLSDIFDP